MPSARQAVGKSGPPAAFQKALAGEALVPRLSAYPASNFAHVCVLFRLGCIDSVQCPRKSGVVHGSHSADLYLTCCGSMGKKWDLMSTLSGKSNEISGTGKLRSGGGTKLYSKVTVSDRFDPPLKVHFLRFSAAAFVRIAGPETGDADITLPLESTSINTLASPWTEAARATGG